jgi:hypothetical protein
MKSIKMFGLAAVAAIAAMAFVGAAAAQADTEVVLCKKAEALCAAANVYPVGTEIKATATNPELLGGPLPEKCSTSETTGKTTSAGGMGAPLLGEIATLTFSSCSPCTSVTSPGKFKTEISVNAKDEYSMKTTGEATISGGFFCFGNVCKFKGENLTLPIDNSFPHPVILTNKAKLQLVSGSESFCGKTGEWVATYTTTLPEGQLSLFQL